MRLPTTRSTLRRSNKGSSHSSMKLFSTTMSPVNFRAGISFIYSSACICECLNTVQFTNPSDLMKGLRKNYKAKDSLQSLQFLPPGIGAVKEQVRGAKGLLHAPKEVRHCPTIGPQDRLYGRNSSRQTCSLRHRHLHAPAQVWRPFSCS